MEEEMLHLDRTIKKIHFLFHYAGINIKSGEAKASDRLKSRIVYFINFFSLNIDVVGSIYWFIDGVVRGKDFLELTYIAPCISLSTLGVLKGMFLITNEKHVRKLIDNLRNLEMEERDREQSVAKEEIVKKELKFLNIVINTINVLYMIVIITFASSPIVMIIVKYYQTKEVELLLPFSILYPFDPFQIKVWPFVYLHQFWSECIVSLNICASDYFFFTCCTYIRIQFRLLQYHLENIIPIQENTSRQIIEEEELKNKIEELIKWHEQLIESANILELIYSKSTLLNFMSSSLIICLTGFNVTMVNEAAFVVTFLSFLFMSLVQVFFLCFFADLLMTSSAEISDAVYNCKWYMTEAKIGKKLLLVQTRAQKPCKITASGFTDVSLNSFMRVLSTAWSYFALLQTMYGN